MSNRHNKKISFTGSTGSVTNAAMGGKIPVGHPNLMTPSQMSFMTPNHGPYNNQSPRPVGGQKISQTPALRNINFNNLPPLMEQQLQIKSKQY